MMVVTSPMSKRKKRRKRPEEEEEEEAAAAVVVLPFSGIRGGEVDRKGGKPKKKRKGDGADKMGRVLLLERGGEEAAQKIENGEAEEKVAAAAGHREEEGVVSSKIRKKPRWPKVDGKPVRPQKNREGEDSQDPELAANGLDGDKQGKDVVSQGNVFSQSQGNSEPTTEGTAEKRKRKGKKKKRLKKENVSDELNNRGEGADPSFIRNDMRENEEEGAAQQDNEQEGRYDLKKVMVGGMPYYSTEDEIHEYFSECGIIAELDCMTFPDTGRFRGMAFITFKTEAAAKRALALDGSDMGGLILKIELCKIKPRDITKKEGQPRPPPEKHEGCKSAYIGNLAWDITEEVLRKFFKSCKIDAIRLSMNKETGEFRGFGHVDFADDKSLEAAIKLDQQEVLGRPLKIAYAVPKKAQREDSSGAPPNLPMKAKTCHTCGKEGHLSYRCPQRQSRKK